MNLRERLFGDGEKDIPDGPPEGYELVRGHGTPHHEEGDDRSFFDHRDEDEAPSDE